MFSQADIAAVSQQLAEKIKAGKLTCHRCHIPLGGAAVTQIDLFNGRIVYKCSNGACDNHARSGYRTFRALEINVPSMSVPADLAQVAAPAPPRPEEVDWSDGSDTEIFDQAAQTATPAPVESETPAPTPAPVQQPSRPASVQDDPDSEE